MFILLGSEHAVISGLETGDGAREVEKEKEGEREGGVQLDDLDVCVCVGIPAAQ